jgi:hypothetical protein
VPNNEINGAVGTFSTPPVYSSMTLSDIYYNAKISQLGGEYDSLLLKMLFKVDQF